MLELQLAVDSSTVQLYLCDLHVDLCGGEGLDMEDRAAGTSTTGQVWIQAYNQRSVDLCAAARASNLVEVKKSKEAAQRYKIYFENFAMHPVKIRLTFVPTPFPVSTHNKKDDIFSSKQYRYLKVFKALSSVDELLIRLHSFIFYNAMESYSSLGTRIVAKVFVNSIFHIST